MTSLSIAQGNKIELKLNEAQQVISKENIKNIKLNL
jgi:hypothetical protein